MLLVGINGGEGRQDRCSAILRQERESPGASQQEQPASDGINTGFWAGPPPGQRICLLRSPVGSGSSPLLLSWKLQAPALCERMV